MDLRGVLVVYCLNLEQLTCFFIWRCSTMKSFYTLLLVIFFLSLLFYLVLLFGSFLLRWQFLSLSTEWRIICTDHEASECCDLPDLILVILVSYWCFGQQIISSSRPYRVVLSVRLRLLPPLYYSLLAGISGDLVLKVGFINKRFNFIFFFTYV